MYRAGTPLRRCPVHGPRGAPCRILKEETWDVVVLDALTYAGDTTRWDPDDRERFTFVQADVADEQAVARVFSNDSFDLIVHFAAESHVDRSINSAGPFVRSNVQGTQVLLDAVRASGGGRFVHISTDEVYGELGEEGAFTEETPFRPNSPYSASKAAADMMVQAYVHTYGMDAVILRPSNNYGPWQYPEKLIPVVISRALDDLPVPVYAQGLNVREWLYVDDCVEAVYRAAVEGVSGEAYNIGSGEERRNIDVVRGILDILGKPSSLIEFVADRPGHDFRYRLDASKAAETLDWRAGVGFDEGLVRTVGWYVDNESWWRGHLS